MIEFESETTSCLPQYWKSRFKTVFWFILRTQVEHIKHDHNKLPFPVSAHLIKYSNDIFDLWKVQGITLY